MAIKIRKDGVVQDLVINANEVRVLDKDGNFRSKNLETVLKELNMNGGSGGGTGTGGSGYPKDAEYVYVKDSEPDMDGVWLDESDVTSDDSSVGSNSVVKEIKSYVNSETSKINASLTNAKAELEEKDTELLNKIETLNNGVNQISNPNLLINGDFQVWQRGTNFSGANIYTADRWKTNFNATITNKNGKAHVRANEQFGGLIQFIEFEKMKHSIQSKNITGTIKLNVISGIVSFVVQFIPKSSAPTITKTITATNGVNSLTLTAPGNLDDYRTFECLVYGNPNAEYEVEYMKVEVSSVATPFVPRPYAEELALCQRYFEALSYRKVYGSGVRMSDNIAEFNIHFNEIKRIRPCVSFSSQEAFVVNNGNHHVSGTSTVTQLENDTDRMLISCTTKEAVLTNGNYCMLQRNDSIASEIYIDAEIY